MNRSFLFFAIALIMAGAVGCAGGGNTPVTPGGSAQDLTAQGEQTALQDLPLGHSLLGYWDCVFDPESKNVEFIPLRSAELHLSLVSVLEMGVMKITLVPPIEILDNVLYVKLKLTHPFAGKLNLSGFDVKGIFISKGTMGDFTDSDIRIAGPTEASLVNADGFSRWWNPSEFLGSGVFGYTPGKMGSTIDPATAATLNGYKLYADGLAASDTLDNLDVADRALFTAGTSNTREYAINILGGLKFNYAVDASWAKPTVNPPVNLPDDFPIEANQPEPWYIQVTETNNTLWFKGGEHGGNVSYEVLIHDWQGVTDIAGLSVECPGVLPKTDAGTLTVVDDHTLQAGFNFVLPDLISANPLYVLFTVDVPGDYSPILTGVDKPLKAYMRHITTVKDEKPTFNQAPVALMHATSPTDILKDETVSFDGTASYDLDGTVVEYQWDFNGDGIYGDGGYTGDPSTPTKTFTAAGTFDVRLKVKDNGGKADTSDPVTVNVTLETNDPPVPVIHATTPTTIDEDQTVSFDASDSYDPDGTIVNYEWDFNDDLVYGDPFTGDMVTPTATFPDPGTYKVGLKVTDDQAGVGYVAVPDKITITVNNLMIPPESEAEATTPTDIDNCGTVTFDASASFDTDGSIAQYLWDFDGDGIYGDAYDSGTDINPTASFSTGAWNVQLKVVDDEGLEDTLDSPIVVTATNIAPTADAVATTPTDIYGGESVTFDASGSIDPDCNDIALYEWDFDGDGIFGDAYDLGTDVNPTVIYPSLGSYEVSLRVTDGEGAMDETDTPITVNVANNPPTACAEIDSPPPYFWKIDIGFSGSCSSDVDGTIVSWEWDLGADGSYEKTGENTSFNFDTAGKYQMQLRVTDNDGDTDLLDSPLSFWVYDDTNMPPEVTAVNHSRTTSTKGSTTETVSLSVDFTDPIPPGDTHTYLWTCPYGSFDDATSATPTWTPPNEVVKCQITVLVTDAGGMFDDGTCNQWVTQWAILNNASAPGNLIISQSLDTVDDGYINPASYKFPDVQPDGNVIYCNFWATWCGPCINEMDEVDQIYHIYEAQQYAHLLIDIGEPKATVENWVNAHGYHVTHWLIDPTSSYYNVSDLWADPPGYIPTHLVFDRDGHCRAQRVGGMTALTDITKYIDELI